MDGFIGVDDEEGSDEAADGEGKRLLLLAPLPPAKGGAFPVAVRLMLAKGDEDLGVEEVRERRQDQRGASRDSGDNGRR